MARHPRAGGRRAQACGPGPAARFLRYAAVGTAATLVHWGLFLALVQQAGWPAWVASGAGALAGAQVAYAGNRVFTFADVPTQAWFANWGRFQLTAAAGALAGMAGVAAGVHAGLHPLAAQALATAAVLAGGYAVNARWTFGRRGPAPGAVPAGRPGRMPAPAPRLRPPGRR